MIMLKYILENFLTCEWNVVYSMGTNYVNNLIIRIVASCIIVYFFAMLKHASVLLFFLS